MNDIAQTDILMRHNSINHDANAQGYFCDFLFSTVVLHLKSQKQAV